MKRLAVLLVLLAAVGALALTAAAPARAETLFNIRLPISFVLTNPCTGTSAVVSGESHLLGVVTVTGSSAHVMMSLEEHFAGGPFVGAATSIQAFDVSFRNGLTGQETVVERVNVIEKGAADDATEAKVLYHITVAATGEVTVDILRIEARCRG